MEEILSCCGVACTQCEYSEAACQGCPAIEGKVFWLEYTGEDICPIYKCCVLEKGLAHCGGCEALPCAFYDGEDPTKTAAQNQEDHRKQLEKLRAMAAEPQ